MTNSTEENISKNQLPADRLYVCPSCTVVRYGDRKSPCPVCGYEGHPDLVSLQ